MANAIWWGGLVAASLGALTACNAASSQDKPLLGYYHCEGLPDTMIHITDDHTIATLVGGDKGQPEAFGYDTATHKLTLSSSTSVIMMLPSGLGVAELRYVPGNSEDAEYHHRGPGLLPLADNIQDLWCPYDPSFRIIEPPNQ